MVQIVHTRRYIKRYTQCHLRPEHACLVLHISQMVAILICSFPPTMVIIIIISDLWLILLLMLNPGLQSLSTCGTHDERVTSKPSLHLPQRLTNDLGS